MPRLLELAILATGALAQCAIRGNCGPVSRFGADLPCVNYTEPEPLLDEEALHLLADICGPEIANNAVCCDADQVRDLASNLKRIDPLVGSCGACVQNFYDVFCQFTCSPHQINWLDIVKTQQTLNGRTAPKEVDYFVDNALAERVYDSCSNVKFSATNGRAMDLIGGGAENYADFFKFLGDEKPLLGGSVFQINFPWNETTTKQRQNESVGYSCGEGELKCSCIDCEASCPPPSDDLDGSNERCMIGSFRCVSLIILLSYALFVVALGLLWLQARKFQRKQSSLEIQRLIQDDEEHYEDDPFALPSSELGTLNLRSYSLNTWISSWLSRQAMFCARYPSLVIALCALFVLCCSLGLVGMQLETDPVQLWVAPSSREAAERSFFNTEFGGGFYRTTQLYVVNDTGGPVLGGSGTGGSGTGGSGTEGYDVIDWLKSVERRVAEIQTPVLWDSLDSFCLKPVGDSCVVESVTQYGIGRSPAWRQRLERCVKQPVNCLPRFQQPIDPHLVFGSPDDDPGDFLDSPALVVTWVLQNSEDPVYLHRVVEWETTVENFLKSEVSKEAASRGLRVSFNVESSLERELGKSGQADVKIIVFSYILMFAYVSLTLGDSTWLGIAGIFVVLCSVTSAVGLLSMLGLHLTLIITEVIPFLALAIGVDNIFLLVHQVGLVSEVSPGLFTIEDQIATAVASVGPSIVLSTSCEVAALLIAALVPMPAVRNFAIFAGGAVLVNSALQLTLFVSMLTLYLHHRSAAAAAAAAAAVAAASLSRRTTGSSAAAAAAAAAAADSSIFAGAFGGPLPDLPGAESNNLSLSSQNASLNGVPHQSQNQQNTRSPSRSLSQASRGTQRNEEIVNQVDKRRFSFIISTEYTPFLLGRRVKQAVGCVFVLWLAVSLYVLPQISLGLDQRLAVPRDSFLVPYFSDVSNYLGVGPPVYYVVASEGVETRPVQQKLCSRFSTCDEQSLVNVLETERKRPEASWLATAPASWIDDFLMWLNPALDTCCVDESTHETCYAHTPWKFNMEGFPEGSNFTNYLEKWLDQPSDQCPLAGRAPYSQALSFSGHGRGHGGNKVHASYFRTNHVPLRTQSDYIHAYAASRRIADRISETLGLHVFPYSIFYPFFAQYTTIVHDTVYLVSAALAVTWLLSWVLLGNLRTASIVTGVVLSLLINMGGLMYMSGVSLNALSLVNLVICVGLGVEFCIHIARSFTFVPRVRAIGIRGFSRVDRAYNALAGTGGTVLEGVAVTKLLGVCVLAFAHSKIFNVYYFRMWLALVVAATLHSLMLLPVLLSVWGGSAWLVESENSAFADLEEL